MKYPFNYVFVFFGIIFLAKYLLRIGFNTRNKDTKSHNTYTDLGCAFNFSFQYGSLKTESKTESTQSQ